MRHSILVVIVSVVAAGLLSLVLLRGVATAATAQPADAATADQVALADVARIAPGAGQARILRTEPDVEHGVAVYDVRVLAPNGTIMVVQVRQSDQAVLGAHPAEHQSPPTAGGTPAPATSSRYFPQTGYTVANGFRAYWEHFGGLATFGAPISEEFTQHGVTVQYFQRARLEYHPTNPPAWQVEGGLLGVQMLALTGGQ